MKKIIIIIITILVLYIAYVTVDCIRLKNSKIDTKPLITISEPDYDNGTKYVSLGYSIAYYQDSYVDVDGNTKIKGYGAEFRLFDSILVWAWIE